MGLTGVALCHDVFIPRTFARARRRLGLAGLAAVLAAHVRFAFKVVFAGHAGSMHAADNGSEFARTLFGCERVHTVAAFCSAGWPKLRRTDLA